MNERATQQQILSLFPNASRSTLAANSGDTGTPTKLERSAGAGALGTRKTKEADSKRFLVRVTSVRTRLLDEDNLCEKYHVDLCRYAGIIHSDDPGKTRIETTQRKAKKGEGEHVTVEIFEL